LLPWYFFAAAGVLYDPPLEEAPVFADYGEPPQLGQERAHTSSVLSELELRQRRIDLMVEHRIDNWISGKAWELRSELGELAFREATHEILRRFSKEIKGERDRLRAELYEREMDPDPPFRYYLEFDPAETTNNEILNLLPEIRAEEGPAQKAGRKPQDDLLPVMCARLLEKPGWTPELLAVQLGKSAKRVVELAKEGKALF
jgi:hypothetical protein